uniref:Uncharacterized protein n=1 Tax=Micrurus lemniscatus lemniscatus TaxID=129467 RepID=A0A2D4IYE0_MICLE
MPKLQVKSKVWLRNMIQDSQSSIHKSREGAPQSKQMFTTNRPFPSVWLNHSSPGVSCEGGGLPCKQPRRPPLCLTAFCSPCLQIRQGRQLFLIRVILDPIIFSGPL